jgi:ketosteroid isomerase-like protein
VKIGTKGDTMKWVGVAAAAVAVSLSLAACGGSSSQGAAAADLQKQADMFQIDQIERTWHRAASTHDVNLMMTLWAPDATFNIGTQTLTGKSQIRSFFEHTAAPFQPRNHWVSDTPSYKIRVTVNGDKGTLYFECHYIDVKTQKVVSVVAADQNVQKIGGKWMITSSAGATPSLGP